MVDYMTILDMAGNLRRRSYNRATLLKNAIDWASRPTGDSA